MKNVLVLASTFLRWEHDTLHSFVYELSRRISPDYKIFVLAPWVPGAKRREELGGISIRRFRYWFNTPNLLADGNAIMLNLRQNPFLWIQVPLFMLAQIGQAGWMIRRDKISMIHAHWIIPQGFCALMARYLAFRTAHSTPIICTSHGTDIFGLQYLNGLKRFIWNRMKGLTVVSHAIKDEIRRIGARESMALEVIPMGVDTERFSPEKRNPKIREQYKMNGPFLLYVGRFSNQKGVNYLLEAMPAILSEAPDATLLLVGGGQEEKNLKALTRSLRLSSEHVVFAGPMQNERLPELYATADLFIGPSIQTETGDREGCGITFIEAMACATPVIATDLPNFKDYIVDGENGYIVPQKDPKAIAEKVKDILSSPQSDVGRKGREFVVQNYDWDSIVRRYNQFYDRMSGKESKK